MCVLYSCWDSSDLASFLVLLEQCPSPTRICCGGRPSVPCQYCELWLSCCVSTHSAGVWRMVRRAWGLTAKGFCRSDF